MHKKILITISILILAVLLLSACSNSTTFKVTFDVDGQVYTTQEVKKGGCATMPAVPVKTGYIFDNWYIDKDVWTVPFKADTVVINDITVYARWIKTVEPVQNSYVITFDSRGGSEVTGLRIKEGQLFTMPEDPTLQDHNFAGWYLDTAYTTPFTTDYKITKNITVYAKWVEVDSTTYFVRQGSVITSITDAGKSAANIVLPETIDGVKITALGDNLFDGNLNLNKITFPANSSYTTIGKEAFKGCKNLKEIRFINGITTIGEGAFMNCTSLTSVNLPTELSTISKNLFKGCSSLKYANLQYVKVDAIGEGAYYGCSSLLGPIKIYSDIKTIGAEAFRGCSSVSAFDIEEGVESIGDRAFYNCKAIKSINIPDSVTSFGAYVFYNCESATTAYLGKGITAIPDYTFYGAKALDVLTLAEGNQIVSIGKSAFNGCAELENFDIPQGVTEIKESAFEGCKDITTFVAPQGVTKIEAKTFMNAMLLKTVTLHDDITYLGNASFMNCGELTTVNGMTGVTEMGSAVFSACKKLDNVVIPATLKVVTDSSFSICNSLKNVVISDGITTIEKLAFSGCLSLEEITLPVTLLSLGDYAFSGCIKLDNVTLNAGLGTLSPLAFDGCTALQNLSIDSGNPYFEAEGGAIYSKGKETLIYYSDALSATEVIIPSGVKKIASGVFAGNETIVSVTLPDTLEEIGENAFKECLNLTSVNFPLNLKAIGQYAFGSTKIANVSLPLGLHTLDSYAFNATPVKKVNLPITLISVGKNLFDGASPDITVEGDKEDLSGWSSNWMSGVIKGTINYGEGRVNSANGQYQYFARNDRAVLTAYYGEDTEVVVPSSIDGITVYGLYKTFRGNTTITALTIPNSVQVISEMSLKGMTSLTSVTLPFAGAYRGSESAGGLFGYVFDYSEDSVSGWKEQYAQGGSRDKYYVEIPSSLTSVTLTDCEVIAYGAFSNMHNLAEITLPSNLKTIKGRAFYLASLTTVNIPLSVIVIESEAFTYNYKKYQAGDGTNPPTVYFNIEATSRPDGWEEGCFDVGSILNYKTV